MDTVMYSTNFPFTHWPAVIRNNPIHEHSTD